MLKGLLRGQVRSGNSEREKGEVGRERLENAKRGGVFFFLNIF